MTDPDPGTVGTPPTVIRVACIVLLVVGWAFARAVGRGLAPTLFRRLDPATAGRVLATIGESFLNFEVAAKREAELRAELGRLSAPVLRVPVFEEDIHDLPGLARLGECLFG